MRPTGRWQDGKSLTTQRKTAFGSNWLGPIEKRRASPQTTTDGNVAIPEFDVVIPPKCKRSMIGSCPASISRKLLIWWKPWKKATVNREGF